MTADVSTPQIAATEGRRSRQSEIEDRTGGEKEKQNSSTRVEAGSRKCRDHASHRVLYDLLVIVLLSVHKIARARMHTAVSALAQLQQQQYSQQMRAASEIAQRSCEPLPITSFVKAHPPTHPIIMVLAIFQRTIEQNDSAASVRSLQQTAQR